MKQKPYTIPNWILRNWLIMYSKEEELNPRLKERASAPQAIRSKAEETLALYHWTGSVAFFLGFAFVAIIFAWSRSLGWFLGSGATFALIAGTRHMIYSVITRVFAKRWLRMQWAKLIRKPFSAKLRDVDFELQRIALAFFNFVDPFQLYRDLDKAEAERQRFYFARDIAKLLGVEPSLENVKAYLDRFGILGSDLAAETSPR